MKKLLLFLTLLIVPVLTFAAWDTYTYTKSKGYGFTFAQDATQNVYLMYKKKIIYSESYSTGSNRVICSDESGDSDNEKVQNCWKRLKIHPLQAYGFLLELPSYEGSRIHYFSTKKMDLTRLEVSKLFSYKFGKQWVYLLSNELYDEWDTVILINKDGKQIVQYTNMQSSWYHLSWFDLLPSKKIRVYLVPSSTYNAQTKKYEWEVISKVIPVTLK